MWDLDWIASARPTRYGGQAYNPSTQMVEAGGSKFKTTLDYTSEVEVCPGLHEAGLKKIKHTNNMKFVHILFSTFFNVVSMKSHVFLCTEGQNEVAGSGDFENTHSVAGGYGHHL